MRFRDRLLQAWYSPRLTPLAAALLPLSWLFAAATALRRGLYRAGLLRTTRLPVPVVVVGNLTAGGAGKTPLVIALAQALRAAGRQPGIVSRGYGGTVAGVREVRAGDDPRRVGDEPLLLAAAGLPVVVGRDRPAAAQALLAAHPACDVILCDDGLQHYALARDVEIVVIDDARGLGNGRLLPAGPLREPASRLRERRCRRATRCRAASPGPGRPRDDDDARGGRVAQPRRPRAAAWIPPSWRGRRVHAIAGIGHPQRFFDLLGGSASSCGRTPSTTTTRSCARTSRSPARR